jgi:hypothetical protein
MSATFHTQTLFHTKFYLLGYNAKQQKSIQRNTSPASSRSGPEKSHFCHLQIWEHEGEVMCGRQGNEEGRREVKYVDTAGDNKSKI